MYFSDFSLPYNFTTELSAVAMTSIYLGLFLSISGNFMSGSDMVPGKDREHNHIDRNFPLILLHKKCQFIKAAKEFTLLGPTS